MRRKLPIKPENMKLQAPMLTGPERGQFILTQEGPEIGAETATEIKVDYNRSRDQR